MSDAAVATFGPRRAIAAAGLGGFACMAAELTAVRLLAPRFGDSAYVWTNVIGVILLAMALGAMLGGRLSGRATAAAWPFRLLLVAALLLALIPFWAGPLGAYLLPHDVPLDAAMPALVRGSLVATALLFAPPLFLLAAVTPLLIVQVARRGVPLGRAAGDIGAGGTIGSLCGTFAATHGLVPLFGSRTTLLLLAGLLAVAAALVAARIGRRTAVALVVLAVAGSFLPSGPLRPTPVGQELLAEVESRYQFLQVVHRAEPAPARTTLTINEGLDSFHSLELADSAFTDGAYYDWHALMPWCAGDGQRPAPLRALSLGDAAGTLRAVYAAVHPGAAVDAVDIDPATMALGDRFFTRSKAEGERFAIDGRVFVQLARRQWQVVHVDAYAHQVYVPAHLGSVEFFRAVRERLLPGGIVACNVGALHRQDPVLQALGATLAEAFGEAHAMLVPRSRNALLVARKQQRFDPSVLRSAAAPASLGMADAQHWSGLVAHASRPEVWFEVGAGGPVLRDGWPLLDRLLHRSYVDHDDETTTVACDGKEPLAAAEQRAFTAAQRGDWIAVLAAVRGAAGPSAYLRELAGDARWSLRQLQSAEAEYSAAMTLADGNARNRLEQKIDGLRSDHAPIERARGVATRNGWFAMAALAATLLLAIGVRRA